MKILLVIGLALASGCASVRNRYHTVVPGDTFSRVAKRYQVPVAALQRSNRWLDGKAIQPGNRLYIPFEVRPDWNNDLRLVRRELSPPPGARMARNPSSVRFSWPVVGTISSYFGKRGRRMHEGIDIAAEKGTPVRAADAGTVIYSGNGIRGYGNLVIVRHKGGFTSVYAHLRRRLTKKGQYVRRDQRVGTVGRTGRATGDHLHFEIRSNRVAVNPLQYLQSRVATNKVGRR